MIWQPLGAPGFLAARSQRWCVRLGLRAEIIGAPTVSALRQNRPAPGAGIVLLRAGAWPTGIESLPLPVSSSSGQGLCAVATPHGRHATAADLCWSEALAAAGGEMVAHADELRAAGLPPALYLDTIACDLLAATASRAPATPLLTAVLEESSRLRIVAWPGLEIFFDARLRVLQVVTSLQRGGAERIALSLASPLSSRDGVYCRLTAPFLPTRDAFAPPPSWFDLGPLRRKRESSLDALLRVAPAFDVLHAHLFKPPELARFCATGVPVVVTVHNSRVGWPAGFAESRGEGLALVAACSLDVETELRAAGMTAPVRTVWNGIDFDAFAPSPAHTVTRQSRRAAWGFSENDLVLLAIANPRSQKRLHLLPPILAAVQAALVESGTRRRARLVFAGQPSENIPDAQASAALVRETVAQLGLNAEVRWGGAVEDIPSLLASGDVLVSAAAHEGLSLVHLEALAMHRPVVCSATAGTRETAHRNPGMRVVPLDATPAVFAAAILTATDFSAEAARAAARRHFDSRRMAERYLWCYRRCVATPRAKPTGLWLITNNFSMGGAQTSARRLLVVLAAQGITVRAATVQEHPDSPTAGRLALQAAGVPVHAFGPHGRGTPEEITGTLLEAMDADPPMAVLFWNLIPVYKLLLADGQWRTRVFDISPGEMFFQSLDTYFAQPHGGLPFMAPSDYGRRLAGVIVKYSAEATVAAALGAPVHVIPNGVPLPPPPPRNFAATPRAALIFGTATRISPQKRLEDVIAALQLARPRLPVFEFWIAGRVEPGCEAYHADLLKLAEDLPVRWLGELPDTSTFLPDLDLFLMSSEPAGCPNALLEALATGRPTIATDVGGAGEQVIDGVTGRLVPARDVAALAEAIVALAHDPTRRAELGRATRRHMEQNFSMARMVDRYREVCLGA